jgi:prepilin signal peptidase PulO-like enzyme (type II secretory pathway)
MQYPIIEVITGLAFLMIWNNLMLPGSLDGLVMIQDFNIGLFIKTVSLFIVSSVMVLIALHDQKTGFVLSKYVYFAITLALIVSSTDASGKIISLAEYLPYIYSLAGAALFFGSFYVLSKGKWMVAGDIEIAALMGALLGWPSIITALYFAFISGSIVGLIKIYNKNANLKSEMPFGPFLIAGSFFAMMFSDKIIEIYAKLILGY